jgi:hypothetical protein
MITNDFVEQVCTEVDSYSEEILMNEFEQFRREQPAICEFVMELTSESTQQIQELSLFLSYMVFKVVKMDRTTVLDEVPAEKIEEAYYDSEHWLNRISEGAVGEVPEDSEPSLSQYVVSELYQPLENGRVLEDEEKAEVFFLLRTVISSLTRSSRGKETQ